MQVYQSDIYIFTQVATHTKCNPYQVQRHLPPRWHSILYILYTPELHKSMDYRVWTEARKPLPSAKKAI